MKHISDVIFNLMEDLAEIPIYRPPKLESPIETELYEAFRFAGLQVDTQIPIGDYRVDMMISSRIDQGITVLVECDGAEFHHPIVDDFRDDELILLTMDPIAHFPGKWIRKSPEGIVAAVIEKWYPGHFQTVGFTQVQEIAKRELGTQYEYPINPQRSLYPLGYNVPRGGERQKPFIKSNGWEYDTMFREIVRFAVGQIENVTDKAKVHWIWNNIDISDIRLRLVGSSIHQFQFTPPFLASIYVLLQEFYRTDNIDRSSKSANEFIEFIKKVGDD